MRIRRFLRIFNTIGAQGLDEFLPRGAAPGLRPAMRAAFFWRRTSRPRAVRLRDDPAEDKKKKPAREAVGA
jgi:hypothetical protein